MTVGVIVISTANTLAPSMDTSRINAQRVAVATGLSDAISTIDESDREERERTQYDALLEMRSTGKYDSGVLTEVLNRLDAQALVRQFEHEAASLEQAG